MTDDLARVAIERAAAEAAAGNGHPAPPPLELAMQNCQIEVVDATDNTTGAKMKLVIVTHVSGGFRVVVPLPLANARLIGNALCDRPNVVLP